MNATAVELWALIVGGVGAVAGVIALFYAHSAKRGGEDTTKLARDANELAKGSNTIALDARRIAMEANDYSHRAEQRETERHDVYWEGDWAEPGLYVLVKRGDDPAHNIKATVTYNDEEFTKTADVVADDGDAVEFEFPSAADDFARQAAQRAKPKPPQPFGMPDVGHPDYHSVTERVEWITALGTPKLHAPKAFNLITFDQFHLD